MPQDYEVNRSPDSQNRNCQLNSVATQGKNDLPDNGIFNRNILQYILQYWHVMNDHPMRFARPGFPDEFSRYFKFASSCISLFLHHVSLASGHGTQSPGSLSNPGYFFSWSAGATSLIRQAGF